MNTQATELRALPTPASLIALAEQLRDGPLQHLLELQAEMTQLTERVGGGTASRLEEIERLVRLSVSTMEHFNAFTREFAAVLRELIDDRPERH